VKINLIEEYKRHLSSVSKIPNFASMKMYQDHTFFKVFMPDELLSSQAAAFSNMTLEDLEKQDLTLKSTILPSAYSFIEP
jgi:hypothetical protein